MIMTHITPETLAKHVEPSGCGVPSTQNQLAVVHDSHGAVTPTAGTHGSIEHFSMSPEAIPVSGYRLGSVESHRLLDASELDRVKYIVEVLRSENIALKEVLERVVSSTKSELVSMNSRFTAAFGELRDMLGNVNHQDFSTMKREIDRLCDHAMSVAPKFAEIDRTTQAVYMRCDGIVFDSDKRFEEQRSDYVDRLRGLGENMSGRVIELENFVQSQLAGYREQFLSIDRRFGKIEAKLANIGVVPSVHASVPSSPMQVGFPTLSQNFVQQPTNVPVPASDDRAQLGPTKATGTLQPSKAQGNMKTTRKDHPRMAAQTRSCLDWQQQSGKAKRAKARNTVQKQEPTHQAGSATIRQQ